MCTRKIEKESEKAYRAYRQRKTNGRKKTENVWREIEINRGNKEIS